MVIADRVHVLANAGFSQPVIAALLDVAESDVVANMRDPAVSPTTASAPPSTPALGETWRDVTSERTRGAWFMPSATRSVQVNWTFVSGSTGLTEVTQIRIAGPDANGDPDWQNAVDIEGSTLEMPAEGDQVRFTGIIPANMFVQVNGVVGFTFLSALELYL